MAISDEEIPVFWEKDEKINIKTYRPGDLSQARVRRFSYKELKRATNGFERVTHIGGFSNIYQGCLTDGTPVKIKLYRQHSDNWFSKEVQILAQLHHKNIIPLIGYCNEEKYHATVLKEMSEGNLYTKLKGESSAGILSWKLRLKIALGAAKGLKYLHTRCVPPLIHRNITSETILLDHKLEAKLASFAALTLSDDSKFGIFGTIGFIDPEYFATGKPSIMSDVFSFGVVLLELITGLATFLRDNEESKSLVQWVRERADEDKVENIVDAKLQGEFDHDSVVNILKVAIQCTSPAAIDRPTITDVVTQLKRSFKLEAARLRKKRKEELLR